MFLRQTINLGGESGKVDADINQFANTFTSNRLVLTVGKFGIVDIFDTNKYANNPKTDFLNCALINVGTFDYAGDAWGYTYGGALEWYQDWWTLRGGVFDLSATPAGGDSPAAIGAPADVIHATGIPRLHVALQGVALRYVADTHNIHRQFLVVPIPATGTMGFRTGISRPLHDFKTDANGGRNKKKIIILRGEQHSRI
jgi:hypothetical protein